MTTHPALAEPIRSVSRIYDLQHDPNPGVPMTYPSPTSGEPVGLSFLIPHAPRHLVLRREVHRAWAEAGFGMLTRATDCLSTQVMAMAVDRDFFGENDPAFGDNVWKYYEYLRENDLFLTHARIDPQVERSKNRAQQRDPHLAVSVVDENDRGVVVRGAKMIATSAPYADEILIWPFGRFSPEESRYAIVFAVPVATPGLRFVCRESFARPDAFFAHPLASRFDEMDTVAVFDDVVVPWDRVFLKADIGVFNELDRRTHIRQYAAHQTAVRLVTKLEFVAGVIIQLAETIGIDSLLHVQDQIGEVLLGVATIRGLMTAGEANAAPGPGGALVPELEPLQAARLLGPQLYPRAIEILQVLGAGGLVASPSSERDLEGPSATRSSATRRVLMKIRSGGCGCSSWRGISAAATSAPATCSSSATTVAIRCDCERASTPSTTEGDVTSSSTS